MEPEVAFTPFARRLASEYRILGTLEVSRDDRAPAPVRGKPRALLAMLLLHRNEVVSTDRLIEALWEGAPPVSAAKILQLYVSQLRKALPEAELRTRAPGYVLELGPGVLDAERFELLLAEGRQALAAGASGRAAALLGEALALWRGSPLAEFAYDRFAQGEIARLEELRLEAAEGRIEADLELGRHAELVAEIEGLVGEHPLRERLRGQLMRSLYACGRQADALAAYADARETLGRELGLEPSRALQELQRRILVQDPALEPSARTPAGGRLATLVPEPLRRRRAAMLVAGGVLLGAGLAAAATELRSTPTRSPVVHNALARIDARTGGVLSETAVGATPTNVAAGRGGVWVLNADDQTISLADPSTGRIRKTFAIGRTPTDVALGAGAAWVGDGAPEPAGVIGAVDMVGVSRVDLRTGVVTATTSLPSSGKSRLAPAAGVLPTGVSRLAVGAGGVWAIDPDKSVTRLDPTTGATAAVVHVTATTSIAADRGSVWFVGAGQVVRRIDPRTNRPGQAIRIAASGLAGIALGAGSVWVTDPPDGLVWRVEPGLRPIERSFDAGVGVTGITFASGAVWVTNFVDGTVLRIDPRTNAITARVRVSGTPEGVSAAGGSAWVTVVGDAPRGSLPSSACSPVQSGGSPPDVLIASDLPLQGPQATVTHAMAAAVGLVLRRDGFKAGRFTVGYQTCDESTAQSGGDDFFKCASNAKAFAETPNLVAVVGPYTSDCAQVTVPIASRATNPLALVSPSNTLAGLTHPSGGKPGRPSPSGGHNYFRVVASDDFQGAGQAMLAHQLGLERMFVLTTGQNAYGETLVGGFRRAARRLGVRVVGTGTWAPAATRYSKLVRTVRRAEPDGVLLAGYGVNGGALIRALRAGLGPGVALIAGDGFLPLPKLVKEAGAAADGVYVTFPGVVGELPGAAGHSFSQAFAATAAGKALPDGTYVPEAAQAAELLVAAIAGSDGTRASVVKELARLHVAGGILGSFHFDSNGDMTPALVSAVRIGRGGRLTGDFGDSSRNRILSVPTSLLEAPGAGG